jgi:TRAP-type C4-dicarboxylate transport system permease small subunit
MEAVFFRLHERFVNTVTRLLPARIRRYLEYASFCNAVCLLAALVYMHTMYVNPKGGPVSLAVAAPFSIC